MSEHPSPSPITGRAEPDSSEFEHDKRSTTRALVEAFVSLFIAVLLFRSFAAEGYMISTGSMAPCLLGYHKRIVCPTCGITFPFGTAYDTDENPDSDKVISGRSQAVCPNCGQSGIDLSDVPRNHGDQLLVNKQAFQIHVPRRWEIVVFRNPARPTEAYVKRIAGLPGEQIQIVNGDVFVNDQIARKSFAQQLATRILVHDHDHRPVDDAEFEPHWQPIQSATSSSSRSVPVAWTSSASSFQFRGGNSRRPDKERVAWVEYHHWIRSGGQHETSVPLDHWPEEVDPLSVPNAGLRFDPRTHAFSVTGALKLDLARRLMEMTKDKPFRDAVCDLYETSHIVPVSDEYGYNPNEETGTPNPVRDLMFSGRVQQTGGSGEFLIELNNGATRFTVVFDAVRREASLYADPLSPEAGESASEHEFGPASAPVASAPLPADLINKPAIIEFSIFDKQAIVAVNGQVLISPWTFDIPPDVQAPRVPVRFGARGLDVNISQIKLYRDIFYTDSRSRHAVNRPYRLKADEYFVLGDNSPVSHDSRRWDSPVVRKSLLIGKPFLVHLPSKPGNLRIGQREMHLRIPDWERIRFLK